MLDGKTLALALNDKTIKLWDAGSGAMLQIFRGYLDKVTIVVFLPDGKTLALALINRTVKL